MSVDPTTAVLVSISASCSIAALALMPFAMRQWRQKGREEAANDIARQMSTSHDFDSSNTYGRGVVDGWRMAIVTATRVARFGTGRPKT